MPPAPRHARTAFPRPASGPLRVALVSDTHSQPHPSTRLQLERRRPHAILHAGDIGDLAVLDELAKVAPVVAVRGNIDARLPGLQDHFTVDLGGYAKLLLLHHAVRGPKLLGAVAALAREEGASLVVCGHSHVPFLGHDKGLAVFNPGSVGPRRFHLPIVFGWMEVDAHSVRLTHVDVETGETWLPPGL